MYERGMVSWGISRNVVDVFMADEASRSQSRGGLPENDVADELLTTAQPKPARMSSSRRVQGPSNDFTHSSAFQRHIAESQRGRAGWIWAREGEGANLPAAIQGYRVYEPAVLDSWRTRSAPFLQGQGSFGREGDIIERFDYPFTLAPPKEEMAFITGWGTCYEIASGIVCNPDRAHMVTGTCPRGTMQ